MANALGCPVAHYSLGVYYRMIGEYKRVECFTKGAYDYDSSSTLISATAIHTWKYLILSNFRSQAGAGMVSTAIGDGVGIPCAVAFEFLVRHNQALVIIL